MHLMPTVASWDRHHKCCHFTQEDTETEGSWICWRLSEWSGYSPEVRGQPEVTSSGKGREDTLHPSILPLFTGAHCSSSVCGPWTAPPQMSSHPWSWHTDTGDAVVLGFLGLSSGPGVPSGAGLSLEKPVLVSGFQATSTSVPLAYKLRDPHEPPPQFW